MTAREASGLLSQWDAHALAVYHVGGPPCELTQLETETGRRLMEAMLSANGHDRSAALDNSLAALPTADRRAIQAALAARDPDAAFPIRQDGSGPDESLLGIFPYVATKTGKVEAEKAVFKHRSGKRRTAWRRPGVDGWNGIRPMTPGDLALYGAQGVLADKTSAPVYVVPNEPSADALRRLGLSAVALPGGDAQRSFGESLECLRDRDVYLWPSNDAAGRSGMMAVHSAVSAIANTVCYVSVNVTLPQYGDVLDFLAAGGDVASLGAGILHAPVAELLGDDSLQVRAPTPAGIFRFTLEEITVSRHAFEAEITVQREGEPDDEAHHQRVNILSASQVTELRRVLDSIWESKGWAKTLSRVFSLARINFTHVERALDVAYIDDSLDEPYLIPPFIPHGVTVIFGDGESCKTVFCESLALHTAIGRRFLGMETPGVKILYLDYEDTEHNFRRRLRRLAEGMGLPSLPEGAIFYWQAKGVPIAELIPALVRFIREHGIGLVVVDSAGPACGGKPEDSDVAIAYFRSVAKLGVPIITVAHITKAGDDRKPFGSNYWHNLARATFFVKRVQEGYSDVLDVGIFPRKANDGPHMRDLHIKLEFAPKFGPVSIRLASFSEAPQELQDTRPPLTRIQDALRRGPLTKPEIAKATKLSLDAVDRAMEKYTKYFVMAGTKQTDGRPATLWANIAPFPQEGS